MLTTRIRNVDTDAQADAGMQSLNEPDFKALVDSHPKAIMLTAQDGSIAYVNDQFERVTGYRQEEIVGHNPSILSSGMHSREFYIDMWQSLERDKRWEGLIWNRRKNGETYPQWLNIYPVEHEGGAFCTGVFMDLDFFKSVNDLHGHDWRPGAETGGGVHPGRVAQR